MANIKNLDRIAEIARDLPALEAARRMPSKAETEVTVVDKEAVSIVTLPPTLNMNIVNAINVEINAPKEELKQL